MIIMGWHYGPCGKGSGVIGAIAIAVVIFIAAKFHTLEHSAIGLFTLILIAGIITVSAMIVVITAMMIYSSRHRYVNVTKRSEPKPAVNQSVTSHVILIHHVPVIEQPRDVITTNYEVVAEDRSVES